MPVILGANSASGGYTVKNSLRFNSGSTDYLNKTFSTSGTSAYIATISLWIKKAKLGSSQFIFGTFAGSPSVYSNDLYFTSSDTLEFDFGNAAQYALVTTQVFRDVGAWYHIVIAIDSTQATAANRVKMYVNGSQITAFGTANYPTQNSVLMAFKNSNANSIGAAWNAGGPIDAYMSEFYNIDGQQLTPSSFGQTDPSTPSSGIWVPKAYTGTYGTNGFYLKFANSASLGTDSSGNGNNWTVNNLTSVDQTTDTPTNNFCTLNPLYYSGSQMTEGNLQFSASGSWTPALSTINPSTGKWYAEFKITQTSSNGVYIGVTPSNIYWTSSISASIRTLSNSGTWYGSDGQKYVDGTGTSYGATFTTGDIIGVALDKTNNTIIFYKNGSSQGSLNLTSSTNSGDVSLAEDLYPYPTTVQANFGSPNYSANSYTDGAGYGNFSYAVPSGYYALCTKNLATYG
jgi:hypothetical protein